MLSGLLRPYTLKGLEEYRIITVAGAAFLARADEAQPYQNLFIDGKIDRLKLPYNYSAPLGLLTETNFEIVEWKCE